MNSDQTGRFFCLLGIIVCKAGMAFFCYSGTGGRKIYVDKVINNNIIRSLDDKNNEIIVMGSGLGFKKKPGDPVDESKIEKIYQLKDGKQLKSLEGVLASIPLPILQAVNEIADYGALSMGIKLNDAIYISLADHINFMIQRLESGVSIPNALRTEIRGFYPGEYEAGMEALRLIKKRLGIELPEDEAGFIALHFINASSETENMAVTRQMMEMIQNVIKVLKYQGNIDLDPDSLVYERFMTHLKYFGRRLFGSGTISEPPVDTGLYQMIKSQYKEAYLKVLRIGEMIAARYGKVLSNDEMIYLTIHVNRLMQLSGPSENQSLK